MEFLSAIVSGVVTEVGKYAVAPVGREVGFVIQYKSNLQNLRTQVDNLKERRQRTNDVNWMTQQVDELTGEVDTFLVDEGHAKTKCFHGFCPNPIVYYQLSKKATRLMHKIKLHEETEFPPQEICSIPSQDYLAFGSRISVVKEIMDELSNPNTSKIGVYGVGGVGKTTLAEEVYRQANEKKLFDGVVIVVDVKNYPERIQKENFIERIQKEIAEKLNIDIRECLTEKGRARHLWEKLKDKKILVILDDVWEKIELKEVGIPPTCNILFTSRNQEVLYSKMGTQKDFSLAALGEEESWRLFEKMAGAVVKDERIREKAILVSNKCGGLPILIVAVASALRKSTLDQLTDALRRLKKLDLKESEEKALLTLEWSYRQLDAEELKQLFLLCGIFAWLDNSIILDDCFKYSMGMGLLKNVDTMEEARASFHSLIRELQNYCLLLDLQDGTTYEIVRMHELVRNVAIRIARRDQHVLLRASHEEELKE